MTVILAVRPRGGAVIHLYSPGYRPSAKWRDCNESSGMCGSHIGKVDGRTTPLADAVQWPARHNDPCACGCASPEMRWCRACLGHAAVLTGCADHVVRLVLTAITPCSCEGRRWVRDECYQAEHPEDAITPLAPYKGLIPCGFCNEDGDADPVEVATP